jgi:hypothetical protein
VRRLAKRNTSSVGAFVPGTSLVHPAEDDLYIQQNEERFAAMGGICVYLLSRRHLPVFFDLPSAIGFSFSLYTWSLRGCVTKLDRVSSSGLVSGTAHLLILIAALKSRFTNSLHAPPLVELMNARSPRPRALTAISCSGSSPYSFISGAPRWLFPSLPSEVYVPTHGGRKSFVTHLSVT